MSEQPFTTPRDEAVIVTLAFSAMPSVSAYRKIETIVTPQGTAAVNVRCSSNGGTVALDEPMCNNTPVVAVHSEVTKTSTTAKWTLGIYDEATQKMVSGCVPSNGSVQCALPPSKDHAYRVVASLANVSELWDGTQLAAYAGAAGSDIHFIGWSGMQFYCTQFQTVANGDEYCKQRSSFIRVVGLDMARMTFGDVAVTVTADGVTSTMPASQLAWDYGDEDLPGPTY